MIKHFLMKPLLAVCVLLVSCAGQTGPTMVALGQDFTLATGQSAELTGEDLTVKFIEVVEDSRCPKNVTCIWAGQVSCVLEVRSGGSIERTVLTQPGLSQPSDGQEFRNYRIVFDVSPYPEAGKEIKQGDYRLMLNIEKK